MKRDHHEGIKTRLQEWAKWRVSGLSISWPTQTSEARMMEYHCISSGSRQSNVVRYWPHLACSELDKELAEWPSRGKVWARRYCVLWAQYIGGDGHGMNHQKRLAATGLSQSTYYRVLDEAHECLIGLGL